MRKLTRTTVFKRDYKRMMKRGLPAADLRTLITCLVEERVLPASAPSSLNFGVEVPQIHANFPANAKSQPPFLALTGH